MKVVVCKNCGANFQIEDDEDINTYECPICAGDLEYAKNYPRIPSSEVTHRPNTDILNKNYNIVQCENCGLRFRLNKTENIQDYECSSCKGQLKFLNEDLNGDINKFRQEQKANKEEKIQNTKLENNTPSNPPLNLKHEDKQEYMEVIYTDDPNYTRENINTEINNHKREYKDYIGHNEVIKDKEIIKESDFENNNNMKKSNPFKKLNGIDILIIVAIILIAIVGIFHISPHSNDSETISFDTATIDKATPKYLEYYNEGEIVKTTIDGINASTGNKTVVEGNIIWSDENTNDKYIKMLIDSNGKKILVGTYKSAPNADVYIDQMKISVDGKKYNNITEVKLAPISVSNFNDLIKGLDKYDNLEITTSIACQGMDNIANQKISNELYDKTKRPSIRFPNADQSIIVTKAKVEDLEIANKNCPELNGQSDYITIRIYNCSDKELNDIKSNYKVINIKEIS